MKQAQIIKLCEQGQVLYRTFIPTQTGQVLINDNKHVINQYRSTIPSPKLLVQDVFQDSEFFRM